MRFIATIAIFTALMSPALGASPVNMFSIDGTCIYEPPFTGIARVECDAMARDGTSFSLVFITDSSKPVDELAD